MSREVMLEWGWNGHNTRGARALQQSRKALGSLGEDTKRKSRGKVGGRSARGTLGAGGRAGQLTLAPMSTEQSAPSSLRMMSEISTMPFSSKSMPLIAERHLAPGAAAALMAGTMGLRNW